MRKTLVLSLLALMLAALLTGCGSEDEKATVNVLPENSGQFIKFLETKVNGDEVYFRIQNTSEYVLSDLTINVELLDNQGKDIDSELVSMPGIMPNNIEERTVKINPVPEWSGNVDVSLVLGKATMLE